MSKVGEKLTDPIMLTFVYKFGYHVLQTVDTYTLHVVNW